MEPRRACLIASAVALVVYLPSLGGGFLYDDYPVIVNNRAIRDLAAPLTILRAEPARPVLSLVWALNYAVSGLSAWSYHLLNVLLHAANAGLLASLFLWLVRRTAGRHPPAVALFAACWFAASPMAAETVAYVASRSSALAALFSLGALRIAVGLLEGRRFPVRMAASLTLFVLALGTKEEAASVPLFLLLLDVFFVADRTREVIARLRVHLPFFLLPAVGLVVRRWVTGTWLPPPAFDTTRYVATQLAAFPGYFVRAVLPFDPAFYRNHPVATWPPQAWAVFGWIGTGTLIVASWRLRSRRPEWSFAVAWLAAGLLPSSSLVALKEMVVDHRAYLGSAGVAFALAASLWRLSRRWPEKAFAVAWLAAALIAVLAVKSIRYQWKLADPVRAWSDAVGRAPQSAEAYRALGEAYARKGDGQAESVLRRAVGLAPWDARGWTNLGAYLLENHRILEAAEAMRAAARLAPRDSRIQDNLGVILRALGREDEAIAAFEAAVAGGPKLGEPRISLAELLVKRGEVTRARGLLDEALHLPLDGAEADRAYDVYRQLPPAERP